MQKSERCDERLHKAGRPPPLHWPVCIEEQSPQRRGRKQLALFLLDDFVYSGEKGINLHVGIYVSSLV